MEKLFSRSNLLLGAVVVILYYVLKSNGVFKGMGGSKPAESVA